MSVYLLENVVKNVPREKIHPDAKFFAQDSYIGSGYGVSQFKTEPGQQHGKNGCWYGVGYIVGSQVSVDGVSFNPENTVITRDELMRAYDLVEQGYTLWFGGDCPVDGKDVVSVALRDYVESENNLAEKLNWEVNDISEDIIAYKVKEQPKSKNEGIRIHGFVKLHEAETLMRDIATSQPEMMAADMVELADYLIAKGWGKHE